MLPHHYPSKLLEQAINAFARLPGIGYKTALRLVLYLLRQDKETNEEFGNAIIRLRQEIKYCRICHNISDHDLCPVCADPLRDHSQLCVVENIRDVMAIENTGQYKGLYHVLGGIISPMDGIGPNDINIQSLEKKVANNTIQEVILALSPTLEGDTTNYYIFKRLSRYAVNMSILARGVSIGDELEYTDEITLARSLINRVSYEQSISVRQPG